MTPKRKKAWLDVFTYLIMGLGAVIILIPLIWMLSTSLKNDAQIFKFPPAWIPSPVVWDNFVKSMTYESLPFPRFFANSIFVTLVSTFGTLLASSIVAFAFARIRWAGRDMLFAIVIMTMMLPREVIIIPEFIMFKTFGWVDTYLPLIVPAFFGNPFYIFLLRQYMRTITPELDQAARMDGCGTWTVFYRIVLPQCVPALLTVTLFSIQSHWNEFLGPLIYLNTTNKFTMSLGLSMFSGQYGTEWGLLMAASLMAMLPILILFAVAQKYFIQGVVVTGVK
jgi:ABC-type glycerol-3-phosphate transport system permease component